MYTELPVILRHFNHIASKKFGEEIIKNISDLTKKIAGKDTYIDENLSFSLQNLLPLNREDAYYMVKLASELAEASHIAPVLLLEKIPTLTLYNVMYDVGHFILAIKNYGGRAVALFLGSDETTTLRVEDLTDVLEQCPLPFYKTLLAAVHHRHKELGVCCSILMRFAAKIASVLNEKDINKLLTICSTLISEYGPKFTEQYIRNVHDFILYHPIDGHLSIVSEFKQISPAYAEFSVRYPHIVFSTTPFNSASIELQVNSDDVKINQMALLKTEQFVHFLHKQALFEDKNFCSLVQVWPNLNAATKANIIFQWDQVDYKQFILKKPELSQTLLQINNVTHQNWLNTWMFCEEVIDTLYVRKRMGILLQDPLLFSIPAKTIVFNNSTLFNRKDSEYPAERLIAMLTVLLTYAVDEKTSEELSAMLAFVQGNTVPLRNVLSKESLVIKVWDRDPWNDYGRSDELFSCTSLGDYNAGNAPAFLADLNLNNLDVWRHGERIGRVRLCLALDEKNTPLLLVDCVDGSERMMSQSRYALIIKALFTYTRWLGIQTIKFNYDVDFNATPKQFIAQFISSFQQTDRVDYISRFLTSHTSMHLLPHPCQPFLESFIKNQAGFVRGALIDIDRVELPI